MYTQILAADRGYKIIVLMLGSAHIYLVLYRCPPGVIEAYPSQLKFSIGLGSALFIKATYLSPHFKK